MTTPGLFLIRDNIFGHLTYEELEICCKVSDSWNESLNKNSSLKKQSLIKYLLEVGGKLVPETMSTIGKKYLEVIPGWNKGVKKIGSNASLDDLKEIKESLWKYDHGLDPDQFYSDNPVFWAASKGDLTLMKFFLETTFDMNNQDGDGFTIFIEACYSSKSYEMVQLIIRSSKDHGIDLNLREFFGRSAFDVACKNAPLEFPKLIFENYEEFGIDIMHEDEWGETALDMLKFRLNVRLEYEIEEDFEEWAEWEEFIMILEEEYAKIDSLEPAA